MVVDVNSWRKGRKSGGGTKSPGGFGCAGGSCNVIRSLDFIR
jgi:hypothetical protein